MNTTFFYILDCEFKDSALSDLVRVTREGVSSEKVFEVDPADFRQIPRSPFAYWASAKIRGLFARSPAFGTSGREAVVGLKTSDDKRFVRLKWELLPCATDSWRVFAKGGTFSPYYRDQILRVLWADNGAELWAYYELNRQRTGGMVKNPNFYFRPGLTWTPRTQKGFGVTALPSNSIFGNKGPAAFTEANRTQELLALMAILNSGPFGKLLALQMAFGSFEVGVVLSTPVPRLAPGDEVQLAAFALRIWTLKRSLDTRMETSHAFTIPAVLQVAGANLAARSTAWRQQANNIEQEICRLQTEVDELCSRLYGVFDHTSQMGPMADVERGVTDRDEGDGDTDEDTDEGEITISVDDATLAAELVAWAIGVAFGRFDIRLAVDAYRITRNPDPFQEVTAYSPASLVGGDGRPLTQPPAGYPVAFHENGVCPEDPGHPQDIVHAVRCVFNAIFDDAAESWLDDVNALLQSTTTELRTWLSYSFFEHHLRIYSKSRRKAPIYWQLATPSASYSVWLYIHMFSKDTLFRVQNDYVGPKLAHEERKLVAMEHELRERSTAAERKMLAAQEAFVEELRTFLDEVKRVAPLWKPNLDDGVIINFAPLWRLVPQHKPWQKEVKSTWDALCDGKYDWAHLAMHLWPERVVPKCAADRSLAIAHGLEDIFWEQNEGSKWRARKIPTRSVVELVLERTSPAVKAALRSLLEAPAPNGGRARGGRRHAASAEKKGGH